MVIRRLWQKPAKEEDDVPLPEDVQHGYWKSRLAQAGGLHIVLCKFVRLAALVSYVVLEARAIVQNGTGRSTVFLLGPLVSTPFSLALLWTKQC